MVAKSAFVAHSYIRVIGIFAFVMGFLGKIGIEPKLVIAQIINFLALVFILRILLYKPILAIFKKREELTKKLEQDLADIEKKKREAEAATRAKLLDAEGRATEIVERARKNVEAFEERSLEENRRYLDEFFRETKARIETAKSDMARFNREAVVEKSRQLVQSFLSTTLQRELHGKLIREASLQFEEIESREDDIAFRGIVEVRTALLLRGQEVARLRRAADHKFGKKTQVECSTEPGLGAGIQIRWGGYVLDGSLAGRLNETLR